MQPVVEDPRLRPILEKVRAGDRLSYEGGRAFYHTRNLRPVVSRPTRCGGRLRGVLIYSTVNRHINPTDVCVASCRLCAFGKRVKDPKAYTMSLDEVWHRAGEGWS